MNWCQSSIVDLIQNPSHMKIVHREHSSRPSLLWLRFIAIGLGILILLWLPIEDTNEVTAIIIALLISGLFALRVILLRQKSQRVLSITLIGLLSGLSIIPLALFLFAFKTGLHSHGFPDYPADLILSMLRKIPLYALGGLCLGFGFGVWVYSRKTEPDKLPCQCMD